MYLKTYLIVAWVVITAITIYAISTLGINLLQYFFGDMPKLFFSLKGVR